VQVIHIDRPHRIFDLPGDFLERDLAEQGSRWVSSRIRWRRRPAEERGSEKLSVRPRLSIGVHPDSRHETLAWARLTLEAATARTLKFYQTLRTSTPFFLRHERRAKVMELDPKPDALTGETVDGRAWKGYQAYLVRIRPWARADFYKRLMERQGCQSVRALAQVTGEDWSRVARVLKILELPAPVLEYLRSHDSPELVNCFTERQLRGLLELRDDRMIWERFQQLVAQGSAGISSRETPSLV